MLTFAMAGEVKGFMVTVPLKAFLPLAMSIAFLSYGNERASANFHPS
jgi:hypothetical protein